MATRWAAAYDRGRWLTRARNAAGRIRLRSMRPHLLSRSPRHRSRRGGTVRTVEVDAGLLLPFRKVAPQTRSSRTYAADDTSVRGVDEPRRLRGATVVRTATPSAARVSSAIRSAPRREYGGGHSGVVAGKDRQPARSGFERNGVGLRSIAALPGSGTERLLAVRAEAAGFWATLTRTRSSAPQAMAEPPARFGVDAIGRLRGFGEDASEEPGGLVTRYRVCLLLRIARGRHDFTVVRTSRAVSRTSRSLGTTHAGAT